MSSTHILNTALNLRVAHILVTRRLNQKQVLAALHAIAPALASISADTFDAEHFTGPELAFGTSAFRHNGRDDWDANWRYKSLCILDAGDRPPAGWEYTSIHARKRPVLIAECPHPHSNVHFTLHDRRLLRRTFGGADTAFFQANTLEVTRPFNHAAFIAVRQRTL